MPSVHQHAGPAADYPDEVTKLAATKDRSTLEALLRGLDDPDAIHEYVEAALDLEDTEQKRLVVGLANRRLDELG